MLESCFCHSLWVWIINISLYKVTQNKTARLTNINYRHPEVSACVTAAFDQHPLAILEIGSPGTLYRPFCWV